MPNKRPFSMKPRFLGQGISWWLGSTRKSHADLEELFGRPIPATKLRKRPGLILRRARGVRPRPIVAVKEIYTRGRRGYTLSDTWSLDHYILSWLPEAISDLRKAAHSYPMGLCSRCDEAAPFEAHDCEGFEIWQGILTKIEDGLLAARSINDMSFYESGVTPWDEVREREDALREEFLKAWSLLGTHFFSLWD